MAAPRVFLDFTVDGAPLGRVIFELYNVSAPKTSENFRALCTGEKGVSPLSQTPLYYKNSIIHRAIPDFMIQGGDFTKHNGTGGESIYGGPFADEDLSRPVDEPGLLVMANKGPNTNGSQFFITLRACPHLTGKHTVFGHVLRGFDDVVQRIAALPADAKDRPTVPVVISNCGELELRRPPPKLEPVERERGRRSVSVASDEESEKGRKRRKRRTPSHSRSRSRSWTRSRSRTPASREDDSTPEDTHKHGTKRSKHTRRDRKEKKSKSKKPKHRSLSASRKRSVEEGGDPAAAPLREETEEEYDARLEREERARIEAAHMRELAEVKRRYANDARRRSWGAGADDGGGVRYKGRGRMKYVDPEMRTRRHGD